MWKVIDARKSEKLRKAGGGEHPKSGHAYKVRRRSPNKSHLRGATETAQKWKEAAFLQSYWGNPNLTQLIPSCPDVPFSRHSRFHPSPFHPSPAISWYISIPHPSRFFLLSFPHCARHHLFPRDYWVTYCRAKHRNSTLAQRHHEFHKGKLCRLFPVTQKDICNYLLEPLTRIWVKDPSEVKMMLQ